MDLERKNSHKKLRPQISNRQLCPECDAYMKILVYILILKACIPVGSHPGGNARNKHIYITDKEYPEII